MWSKETNNNLNHHHPQTCFTVKKLLFIITSFALPWIACNKENATQPQVIEQTTHTDTSSIPEDRSTYTAPTGWIPVAGTLETGCKTFKKVGTLSTYYMQVVELDKAGVRIEPFAYPVTVNLQFQPTGSAPLANSAVPNPWLQKMPVSDWWLNASSYGIPSGTNDRLYSITNGTFFDPILTSYYTNCSYACRSVYPVKRNGSIVTCGFGGNAADFARTKKAFVVSESSNGTKTPNVIGFSDSGSNPYSYSSISTAFSSYKQAMVGFATSSAPGQNSIDYIGRTAIGVNGSNVFIFTASNANVSNVTSSYAAWGVTDAKTVMLDGSFSSQTKIRGTNYVSATRCVPSLLNVYYGN